MKTIIAKIKQDKSLWKAVRLRFYTILTALGTMYVITGNPITSVGLTAAQQTVSFGIHYVFEEQERKNKLEEINIQQEMRKVKRRLDKELPLKQEIEILGTGR